MKRNEQQLTYLAVEVVDVMADQERALNANALPYLDRLMDAVVAAEAIDADGVADRLSAHVPRLNRSQARQLVDLKFGNPSRTKKLGGNS